jgi:hypothetical protein
LDVPAQRIARRLDGWHLSNQKGYGALGLVFGREAVTTLLSQARFIRRPQRLDRGWKLIDGGIIDCLRPIGWREWVHTPSLPSTTPAGRARSPEPGRSRADPGAARRSTAERSWEVSNPQSPIPNPPSLALAPRPSPLARADRPGRLRLPSGLGEVNRQLARWLPADEWLVIPRGRQGPGRAELEAWVRSVDVVVFAETPLPPALAEVARRLGRRIVCVPMLEWFPTSGWVRLVDLFLCPTRQCYQAIRGRLPAVEFPWPVDVERFAFRPRTRCGRFLFVEGRGGWQGRKGAAVVRAALGHWPGMPLVVRSQRPERGHRASRSWAPWPTTGRSTRRETCSWPRTAWTGSAWSRWRPWPRGCPWSRRPARRGTRSGGGPDPGGRAVQDDPPADALAPARPGRPGADRRELVGQDLSAASQEARAWAESRAWAGAADALRKLILGS